MLNRSFGPLYERLDKAHEEMKGVQTDDEFMAVGNYIGNVYRSLICMGDTDTKVDPIRCFGTKKEYKRFLKRLDVYSDDLLHHFVCQKDFHSDFIGEILPTTEEELQELCPMIFQVDDKIKEQDFKDIFYLFLDSVHMLELYEELLKNRQIHSCLEGTDEGNIGFTLYNPMNGDLDLFIKNYQTTYNHMTTLAHEMGHGYDMKHFTGDAKAYNQYFYLSYYGEVLSRLMERLLHRFCIRNGLLVPVAKDQFINFEDLNHDYLLQGYILSLLDSSFLLSEGFHECDSSVLAGMVQKHFVGGANIQEYIEGVQKFDFSEIFSYLYGDILSLFLCDEVEKNGMNSELMDYFMQHRGDLFEESFMRECGFGPGNYTKLYKKETELIKK